MKLGWITAVVFFLFLPPVHADSPLHEVRTGTFPFYRYTTNYDIWEFTPMDQGGRQIQLLLIGSERDVDIIKAIRSPGFFSPWGSPIRWDSLERTEIEKSVWLNRWYFLPCFAHQYYLTGDKAYLRELLAFVRKWMTENPAPKYPDLYFLTGKYNWRDMQVAWRTQNLIWCYFLGREGYTADERQELFELIQVHAHVLLEYYGEMPLNENNHQSHGAGAMLSAALLFPDMQDAAALKEKAFTILNHHLEHAFFEDGNSVELVPGYYPFFASIFRDAFLLCRSNNIAPPLRCEERLKQFYQYINVVAQPNGKMPPINDSTESSSIASLRVLADVLGETYPPPAPTSHWLSASDQAIMRDNSPLTPAYAFLDAGPNILAHWHSGKLGFHLWYWDKALLVDSGISDYDDPLRNNWYVQPEAHNTILVDGTGDYDRNTTQPLAGSRIAHWESNDKYDWAVMTHTGFQDRSSPVFWTRHFLLIKGIGTVLVDQLESEGEHDYTWLFHLLPCTPTVNKDEKSVYTAFAEKNMLLLPATSETLKGPVMKVGTINREAHNIPNPVPDYTGRGSNVVQAFLFLPVAGGSSPVIHLNQLVRSNQIVVELAGARGSAVLKFTEKKNGGQREYFLNVDSHANP
jgi:hypothetical protein